VAYPPLVLHSFQVDAEAWDYVRPTLGR
jgi:hypothetical protein